LPKLNYKLLIILQSTTTTSWLLSRLWLIWLYLFNLVYDNLNINPQIYLQIWK